MFCFVLFFSLQGRKIGLLSSFPGLFGWARPFCQHRLRAVCRPEQGEVGSRAHPSTVVTADPFVCTPKVFVMRTSSAHKTCVVRKPEVSSIYCTELSTRPPSGGAGHEDFLSLVALPCIFLFTLEIATGLQLIPNLTVRHIRKVQNG